MMSDKMTRFLNSIGINNTKDFDLEFDLVGYDRFDKKQLNMVIVKSTPWEYVRLREFQDGLSSITYRYAISFSYINNPTIDDVKTLFYEWYQTLRRIPAKISIKEGSRKESICFVYKSKEEVDEYHNDVMDFKDFLNFINYNFIVEETTDENTDNEEINNDIEIDNNENESSYDVIGINEEEDSSDLLDKMQEEHRQLNEEIEKTLLAIMEKNKKEMEKERELIRIRKHGNYSLVDKISDINIQTGNVDFNGTIYKIETNNFRGKISLTLGINDDFNGTIYVKAKQNSAINAELINSLTIKSNIRVRGVPYFDEYSGGQLVINAHYLDLLPPNEIAKEELEETRVELHLHSNMSNQDGITKMSDYINYAKALGHKAIAVTDHGVVQSFPDAQNAAKKAGIKMLYGCELYMVNNLINPIFNPKDIKLSNATYVVLDLETTGLSAKYDKIIEFGATRVEKGTVVSTIDILINPERKLSSKIVEITGINDDLLTNKPTIKEVIVQIIDYIKDAILVTHNAKFDFSFLQAAMKETGNPLLTNPVIDTLAISRILFPENAYHNLGTLCRTLDVKYDEDEAHRADYDAKVLNDVWQPLLERLIKKYNIYNHSDLANIVPSIESVKKQVPYHTTVLVKNLKGLRDLYELISVAHTETFYKVPITLRDELIKRRENLLVGSACFNGELFEIARNYEHEELIKAMKFYDYIEVQPLENYSYLVNMGELTLDDVRRIISDIIDAADELHKPVVATGDVHYLTKKEKVFRDVYISSLSVGGAPHALNPYKRKRVPPFDNPDQHYRTTQEMLNAFAYLGEEKAYEIVVKNTNMIADSIESIMPAPNNHLYTPTLENCETNLRNFCYDTCKKIYGDPIPAEILFRLDKELNGIIGSGYAVTYWIAHELVAQANKDGYIIGSRGSVGSSFAATMAGITEVNPLAPHYICPKCHKLIWGKDCHPEVRSGYDLPDLKCPECGTPMNREGQNIPFETFLGFEAEKVPDIDLNFPGDYQPTAHKYTKVLFEEHHVFRAGTIGTVAEKTAFGYARGYLEKPYIDQLMSEEHLSKKDAEAKAKTIVEKKYNKSYIDYLASGCVDVRRTTGQHPGGIVVVPMDHEIYDFCPVQYPADDANSEWLTTHFDFESIHETLLKLDMLGHDDPMALKMMCELSNVDLLSIPLSDPNVLSLFSSPKALNLKDDPFANKTGACALPEFGTENTRRTLEATNPKTFSDLVIISGLSHGTGVWAGNAEDLIKSGTATLQNVIGCRDDIMTYLISQGIEPRTAFNIMETVRKKNKFLSEEQIAIMKEHHVPQFYIDSCNKIEYLFPKGHATAYCMMAVRVGFFKVYYPLEFYATYFTIRSDKYDISTMISGENAIISKLNELKLKSKSKGGLSKIESDVYKTLQVAIEMYERGYKFNNIDLYKSDSKRFIIDKENKALIPPFCTIHGLGEHNAESVVEERKIAPFTSQEDLLNRTHLTETNVKQLEELGVLNGMPKSKKISLFDFDI